MVKWVCDEYAPKSYIICEFLEEEDELEEVGDPDILINSENEGVEAPFFMGMWKLYKGEENYQFIFSYFPKVTCVNCKGSGEIKI